MAQGDQANSADIRLLLLPLPEIDYLAFMAGDGMGDVLRYQDNSISLEKLPRMPRL
jgi:hypothetical protein